MKSIQEWEKESEARMFSIAKDCFAAEAGSDAEMAAVANALAFAAENYVVVLENKTDGFGVSTADAVHRARRALEDGARQFVMAELRSMKTKLA